MGYGCGKPCVARPLALLRPLASRRPAVKAVMSSSFCVLTSIIESFPVHQKVGRFRTSLVSVASQVLFFALSRATKAEVHADNMGSRLLRHPAESGQNMCFLLENRSPSPLRLLSKVTRPLKIPVEVSGPSNF